MKWFKHDARARNDAKLAKIILRHGVEGYGLYFACLEIIAEELTPENFNFELEHDSELLAAMFRMDTMKVEKIMRDFIELGLFELSETSNRVACYKLAKRLDNTTAQNKEVQAILSNFKKLKVPAIDLKQIRLDKKRRDKKKKNNPPPETPDVSDPIPYQGIFDAYNKFCPSLRRAKELNASRRDAIRSMWKKYAKHPTGPLGVFDNLFKKAEASDFLSYRNGKWDRCCFDWLLKPANVVKVIEGNYDNTEAAVEPPPAHGPYIPTAEDAPYLAALRREGIDV